MTKQTLPSKLNEGFEVGDLKNVLHNKVHIDEFSSKLGDDDQNIVISFMLDDKSAAEDLVTFLESGYDFILDADLSTSEIKPGSYLVFVELPRRSSFFDHLNEILDDLRASSEIELSEWVFRYLRNEEYHPFTKENILKFVPISPRIYRERFMQSLDEVRIAAGIPIPSKPIRSSLMKAMRILAGLPV